jgi:hypothetical protein
MRHPAFVCTLPGLSRVLPHGALHSMPGALQAPAPGVCDTMPFVRLSVVPGFSQPISGVPATLGQDSSYTAPAAWH